MTGLVEKDEPSTLFLLGATLDAQFWFGRIGVVDPATGRFNATVSLGRWGGCRPPLTASQCAKVMWRKPQNREDGG